MKPRTLTPKEQEIVAGNPSAIEQQIQAEREAYQALEQSQRRPLRYLRSSAHSIKVGMSRARQWGKAIGRPLGQESAATFLNKSAHQPIIAALQDGLSLRQTAQRTGAAVNTIRKVKAMLEGDVSD
jgi:hypothetical protein